MMRPFTLENARDTADAVRLASVDVVAHYRPAEPICST
jgi:hypothetical protein